MHIRVLEVLIAFYLKNQTLSNFRKLMLHKFKMF